METKTNPNAKYKLTTKPVIPNPTGKGGFGDHPEHASPGGWNSDYTFSYQYKRFLNMKADVFLVWDDATPESEKTVVEKLAWAAVNNARKDLRKLQEIANRTEGMPKQTTDLNVNDQRLVIFDIDGENKDNGANKPPAETTGSPTNPAQSEVQV